MQYTLSSSSPLSASAVNSFITDKKAVNVLPDPVGDETSILFPLCISGIACFCAGVKSSKLFSNHSLTYG